MSKQQLIEEVFGADANLYADALCIDQFASEKEIEKAYLRQWQVTRRELTSGLSVDQQDLVQKRLEALLLAYRILSSPELRAKYDDMLTEVSVRNNTSSQKSFVDDRQSSISGRGNNTISGHPESRFDDSSSFNTSNSTLSSSMSSRSSNNSTIAKGSGVKNRKNKSKVSHSPKFVEEPLIKKDSNLSQSSSHSRRAKADYKTNLPLETNNNMDFVPGFKAAPFLGDENGSDDFIFDKNNPDDSFESYGDNSYSINENTNSLLHTSCESRNTITPSFDSQIMAANVSSATIQEDEENEDDDDDITVGNGSLKTDDGSVLSDPFKDNLKKKSNSFKVVTFKDDVESPRYGTCSPDNSYVEGDEGSTILQDDEMTVGDSTIDTYGESTVGSVADDEYEFSSGGTNNKNGSVLTSDDCFNFMTCAPFSKQIRVNKMIQDFSDEVRGSFDDTISAVDQVFNAFTIQPDEFSGLLTKIETEKQTLGFSSQFINMAQAEREKRLSANKQQENRRTNSGSSRNSISKKVMHHKGKIR